MPERSAVHLVFVTGPDRETLHALGRRLVEERLVACANLWDGVDSIYRWKGEVEEASEAILLLKTTGERLEGLRRRVARLHPYEEPEFVAVAVDAGSPSYLRWVADSVIGD